MAWPSKADFYAQEYIFQALFFFRVEGTEAHERDIGGGEGSGRETLMYDRETDWLPSACFPNGPGMEPKIQVPGLDLKSNP